MTVTVAMAIENIRDTNINILLISGVSYRKFIIYIYNFIINCMKLFLFILIFIKSKKTNY